MGQRAPQMAFEMIVKDVFAFGDGRTVFTGVVTRGPSYIRECACELLLEDMPVARFKIEGERVLLNKAEKNLRSLSTLEVIDSSLIQNSSKAARRLRSVDPD